MKLISCHLTPSVFQQIQVASSSIWPVLQNIGKKANFHCSSFIRLSSGGKMSIQVSSCVKFESWIQLFNFSAIIVAKLNNWIVE